MSDKDLTISELIDILNAIGFKHGDVPVRCDGAAGTLHREDVWAGIHRGKVVVNLNGSLDDEDDPADDVPLPTTTTVTIIT